MNILYFAADGAAETSSGGMSAVQAAVVAIVFLAFVPWMLIMLLDLSWDEVWDSVCYRVRGWRNEWRRRRHNRKVATWERKHAAEVKLSGQINRLVDLAVDELGPRKVDRKIVGPTLGAMSQDTDWAWKVRPLVEGLVDLEEAKGKGVPGSGVKSVRRFLAEQVVELVSLYRDQQVDTLEMTVKGRFGVV